MNGTRQGLGRRFAHHAPSSDAVVSAHEAARDLAHSFAVWATDIIPPCPELDKAVDALDLACMHLNAAIARTQLAFPDGYHTSPPGWTPDAPADPRGGGHATA